jgi:glycosidase
MKRRFRKWILRTFFKNELETLYWAFANIESQINKTHVHKQSRDRIEKSILTFRRAFIDVQIERPKTKQNQKTKKFVRK